LIKYVALLLTLADPMADTVAQWFSMIERQFVSLADAMPADRYGFAPTSGEFKGVRTFGEQVQHVACANFASSTRSSTKSLRQDARPAAPAVRRRRPS
jgi:hypothetical protein